jgi:hypothetical protein
MGNGLTGGPWPVAAAYIFATITGGITLFLQILVLAWCIRLWYHSRTWRNTNFIIFISLSLVGMGTAVQGFYGEDSLVIQCAAVISAFMTKILVTILFGKYLKIITSIFEWLTLKRIQIINCTTTIFVTLAGIPGAIPDMLVPVNLKKV